MTGIASFVILSAAKDLYVALSCGIEGSVLPYISMHPTTFREEPFVLLLYFAIMNMNSPEAQTWSSTLASPLTT